MWIRPGSLAHKQLNWFKTWVVLLNVALSECVSNISVKWNWFLHCITANTLSYCYCTCSWWRPWMSRWYDISTFCLGLETFPVCWLRHRPNTGSTDPEQIAGYTVLKKNTHTFQTQGTKCSFKHVHMSATIVCNSSSRPFSVCDHFKSDVCSRPLVTGWICFELWAVQPKSLLTLFHLNNFRRLKR